MFGLRGFMGQPVMVMGRTGIAFRGIMDGFGPRGIFIRDGLGRRRFFTFVLIAAIFSRGRRIF